MKVRGKWRDLEIQHSQGALYCHAASRLLAAPGAHGWRRDLQP
jgi:hypothetical protein